jgi:hypothetical protein
LWSRVKVSGSRFACSCCGCLSCCNSGWIQGLQQVIHRLSEHSTVNSTVESDAALRDHPIASVDYRILQGGACHSEVKLLSAERTICVHAKRQVHRTSVLCAAILYPPASRTASLPFRSEGS